MRTTRNKKNAEEILRRYKRGDNEFRNVSVETGDLSRRRLAGIVFEGASLVGCNFEGSILKQARSSNKPVSAPPICGRPTSRAPISQKPT
jgi:uncharacterized protein YjbI with pentapeptide repeats